MVNLKSGDIVKAKVTAIMPYGAFIETFSGQSGLIHISEISDDFIADIHDYLLVGDIVKIRVIKVHDNKIDASLKKNNPTSKKVSIRAKHNLKYDFSSLKENLFKWENNILEEMRKNKLS